MVSGEANQKVQAGHLKRNAYLYIRQSTPRQVLENTESTRRQYALQQRAVALGWAQEQVIVIDNDQGQTGATAVDREGFQKLVTEVSMGRAGIVLGLEVSRLARNSADWHRLLEICALSSTLILDEDGIYDPAHFNDRLLLGLKGTMSEAELHVLYARLRGGMLNKAKRGEVILPPPAGLVYNEQGQIILDPDQAIQQSIRLFFATFRRTGSIYATVRAFREQGLKVPVRPAGGAYHGELVWGELECSRAASILHNPRYTGAFVYGRTRFRKKINGAGRSTRRLPREEWHTVLRDAHPGYIGWEEYEDNLRRLEANRRKPEGNSHKGAPREGPALLQGLALCGRCGAGMHVCYHSRHGRSVPTYVCRDLRRRQGGKTCQSIDGTSIEEAISQLILESVTPLTLDVALQVQEEVQSRLVEADRWRQAEVKRARYEAQLAQRRYMQVDPDNRLVADTLEADWNQKLRALAEAQTKYQQQREADSKKLEAGQQAQIRALARDFPKLWKDPRTPDRERKRMVRLLLEDVTVLRDQQLTLHIRFKGGAVRTLHLPRPLRVYQQHKTDPAIVAEIDRLLNQYTSAEIAGILNERGLRTGEGNRFILPRVKSIERLYGLKSRYERLRAAGMLTRFEVAGLLGITRYRIERYRKQGLLRGHLYNSNAEYLYEPPDPALKTRPGAIHADEVQYEA
jgi:DNA invertase Pin-like site-specific DNA recombinase